MEKKINRKIKGLMGTTKKGSLNLRHIYAWMIMVCACSGMDKKKNGVMHDLVGDIIAYLGFILSDLFVLI